MAAVAGNKTCHATLSTTTADTVTLNDKVRQVRVTNHDGTNIVYVTTNTRTTAAGAVGATTAVAQADETISIPTGGTKTVWRSSLPQFIELSVVGNGGSYSVEGTATEFDD